MELDLAGLRSRCGLNLRRVREEKRMSIETLSVLSGISLEELSGIEAGICNCYITTLFLLADELNVDFRRIFVDYNYQQPHFQEEEV